MRYAKRAQSHFTGRLLSCIVCWLMSCLLFAPALALGEAAAAQATASQNAAQTALGAPASTLVIALGSADVSLTADVAVLTLDVNATAATVTEAQADAAAKLDALRTALEPFGVKRESIYTSYYNVSTIYNYQYGKLGDTESLSGYKVESDVSVYVQDAARVGEVIDAALQNGAESSYELTFESSEKQAAYDAAMTSAVSAAMRKAKLLAEAAGLELDKLVSVRELGDSAEGAAPAETAAEQREKDSPHSHIKVNATVEVVYSIK